MRRDIQLLRGIAVLAVVFYHANFYTFSGGYLGVDLFFVISGFVITGRLLQAKGDVKAELLSFYKRRVKRILPSSLAVILLTTIASAFFLAKISLARFAQDAVASALMGGNILFAHQKNDYLSQSLDPSPFLHYWSLGVEEQFYLLWPVLFLLVIRKRNDFVIPLFIFSAIFALWFTSYSPISSFYLPFSRVFEFLGGALIAIYPRKKKLSPRKSFFYFFFPLYLLVNLFVTVDTSYQTPGASTIFLVLLAMAIIWTGATPRAESKISNALIWFGDLSFTLYLVHWPVTVIFMARTDSLTLYDKWEIVLISTAIAILITKYIETPMRFNKKLFLSLPKWGAAIVITAALSFSGFHAFAQGSSGLTINLAKPAVYTNGCHLSLGAAWPKNQCIFANPAGSETLMLVGDSHAAQWYPAALKIARDNNWRLISITKSSCPATLLEVAEKSGSSCKQFQNKLIAQINSVKPTHLLISNFTEFTYPLMTASSDYAQSWVDGQRAFISKLSLPASSIAFLGDTPYPIKDSATCLSLHANKPAKCDFQYVRSDATQALKAYASENQIRFIDSATWLCSEAKCPALFGKINNYRDSTHISVPTAQRLSAQLATALTQSN